MTLAVISGFLLAIVIPWIYRVSRRTTGWLAALLPFGLTIYFGSYVEKIAFGEVLRVSYPWIPALGVNFSFYLDGLSLFFSLLITGIGTLVLVYSGGYMPDNPLTGRFYSFLLMFMASMIGLVLADNLVTLFVFWELTSLSSYLLIGYEHEREAARTAALQALLVTGVGGLALLAGFLLLGQAGGSLEFSVLLNKGELIRSHPLYSLILLSCLAGAFTKSAQFPFHFWLPSAMEAPTPVSAYLHSSTMVKAGIYLLARLNPVLGGTEIWLYALSVTGAVTMLLGAYIALQQNLLKRILAYTTISMLGTLTMLIGFGTELAIKATAALIFTHALYKGALFLVAGAIDHETGERDVRHLGGLLRDMPVSAMAAGLAMLSMAGIPPFLGFISKESLLEVAWNAPYSGRMITLLVLAGIILTVAVAGLVGIRPFFGRKRETPKLPHESPLSLWLGPMFLGILGLFFGLFPNVLATSILSPVVNAISGKESTMKLALWHGLSSELVLSIIALGGGILVYSWRDDILRSTARLDNVNKWGPSRGYSLLLDGINAFARIQTKLFQSGYLRFYLIMIVLTTVGLGGYTYLNQGGGLILPGGWQDIRFYEAGLAALILAATLVAVRSRSRLGAIAALGVVGYGVALIFTIFGAPDLAMTQFVIETIMVVLFVLVFYRLPPFFDLSTRISRVRDLIIASLAGGLMTVLILAATGTQFYPSISGYFSDSSFLMAHGRNVVNVILVDFRGIDTLGEITVLAVAGVGVYALIKLRIKAKGK